MSFHVVTSRFSLLLAVVALGVVTSSCTSFAFRNKGGSAPSELSDRAAMVKIPGGSFQMGALNAEPDEYPLHKVTVRTILMDRTEVTVADYTSCVNARVCLPPTLPASREPTHPITGVTWTDARTYCTWVNKRLPTEAEWEFAARAPKLDPFPWTGKFDGSKLNSRGDADGYAQTAPVGSFPTGKSGYGLLDMAGNAAEWTADWYDATWYQKSPEMDPKGPDVSTGARAVRGGSWADNDFLVRANARSSLDPAVSNNAVGFRCAADEIPR